MQLQLHFGYILERVRSGKLETDGRMEEWKGGRVEEWKVVRMEVIYVE